MRTTVGIVYELDRQIAETRAKDDGRVRVTWRETPDGKLKTATRDPFSDADDFVSFLTRASMMFGAPISDEEQRARDLRYAEIMAKRRAAHR